MWNFRFCDESKFRVSVIVLSENYESKTLRLQNTTRKQNKQWPCRHLACEQALQRNFLKQKCERSEQSVAISLFRFSQALAREPVRRLADICQRIPHYTAVLRWIRTPPKRKRLTNPNILKDDLDSKMFHTIIACDTLTPWLRVVKINPFQWMVIKSCVKRVACDNYR